MAFTTPGISPPAASLKITSRPGSSSISLNWSRGTVWMFCTLPGPKPRSGSISKLRWSPALRPNRACSKPGNRLPSPTLKVAGFLPTVESTTSPLGSFRVKCRVTSVFWLMRVISVMCRVSFCLVGLGWDSLSPPAPLPRGERGDLAGRSEQGIESVYVQLPLPSRGESGRSEALLRPLERPELCEGPGRGAGLGRGGKQLTHPILLRPDHIGYHQR